MTKKEYLFQTFTLHRLLKAKETRIKDLRMMQESVGNIAPSTTVGGKSRRNRDPMGDAVAKILDLISEYESDCLRLLSIQEEIKAMVETCGRDEYRLILFERYVNRKPWDDIAHDNGYSEKHVHKLHNAALKLVKWIPDDNGGDGDGSSIG